MMSPAAQGKNLPGADRVASMPGEAFGHELAPLDHGLNLRRRGF
jgi:hypothetical protein